MISAIAEHSARRARAVVVITLALTALALVPALHLRLDALPDLTTNQVVVLTAAPGLSPEEVETTVTRPLELALSGLPGLEEQRSLSRYGISSITAVFFDDVDPYRARQIVAERLGSVSLPPQAGSPQLAPLTGGLGEVFHVTLSSALRTPAELLELSDLRVAPLLKQVAGVVEVNSWGGAVRTYDVIADPAALATRGISLDELKMALERSSGSSAGGSLAAPDGQVLLRALSRPGSAAALGSAVVAEPAVRAAEIGRTEQGHLLRLGAATAHGGGETVYLMVQMLRDENALEVLDRIHQRMPAVRAALPEDVRLQVVYDRSELVGAAVHTVAANLLEGGALVVGVLLVFLGSARAGLIAASVIPLSMVFATAAMSLLDLPGNLMSLGALDFGLLVDGAVVLVEGIFHHAEGRPEGLGFRDHVCDVARRTARPVFFSVLVILLVYVPVLSMTGTDGKLFRPMALTVVLALSVALVLSMTWVPAMLTLAMKFSHVPDRPPFVVRLVELAYPRLLDRLLPHPLWVGLGAGALLLLGGWVASSQGVEFTPQLDEGDLVIQTTRHPDISLEKSIEASMKLERLLLENVPEVEGVVSRIGSPAVATDIMGFEQADVFVSLESQGSPGRTRDALVADMQALLEERDPGSEPAFTQPIQMRFNELLGGAVTDVAVSLYGPDLQELRRLADALAVAFDRVPGAEDVRVLAPPTVPVLTVRPRPLELAQLGLEAGEVLQATQAVRVGLMFGETLDGPLRIPLRLKLDASPHARDLAHLPFPLRQGGMVPLGTLADIQNSEAAGLVNRRNGERRLVIGFNVRGAALADVVRAAQQEAARHLRLPSGYRLEWGGQYESLQQAARRLAWIVPIVLLLILSVLAFTFRAVRPALSVFAVVPVAVVGGVLTLALRGMPISLPAAIGFIALSGIAVMNGVVWMARALELEEEALEPHAVARSAALERARPVLMTALVAALGFVPMMLATSVGAEVQRPLATVVVGGLVTSTLLTLVVLPVLYPWIRGRATSGSAERPSGAGT